MKQFVFSPLDKSVLGMVNSGSWLFDYQLDARKLKEALSAVLAEYPLFAGRMTSPDTVSYDENADIGNISFSMSSEADMRCDDLKATWRLPAGCKAALNLADFKKGRCAPLSVKGVALAGGFILSVAVSHCCADGSTLYQFVNDLAAAYCGGTAEKTVIDQSLLPQLTDSKEELMKMLPAEGWCPVGIKVLFRHIGDSITGRVNKFRPVFRSNSELEKIRGRCASELCSDGPKTGSAAGSFGNNALYSAILTRMAVDAAVAGGAGEACGNFSVASVVDLRGRAAGIPPRFIGNAVVNVTTGGFDAGLGIGQTANIIDARMRRLVQTPGCLERQFKLALEAMKSMVPFVAFDLEGSTKKYPNCLIVNNFTKFPVYKADFGGGIPLRVWPNDLPDTVRIWPGSPSEEGVWFLLKGNIASLA